MEDKVVRRRPTLESTESPTIPFPRRISSSLKVEQIKFTVVRCSSFLNVHKDVDTTRPRRRVPIFTEKKGYKKRYKIFVHVISKEFFF